MDADVNAKIFELDTAVWSLWAKSGDGFSFLPLPQHLVDTAEVARSLWDSWLPQSVRALICKHLKLDDDQAQSLVMFCAAAHDLGKATLRFQRQIERTPEGEILVNRVRDAGFSLEPPALEATLRGFRHELASGILVEQWAIQAGFQRYTARTLANVVDAHHGKSSDPALRETAQAILDAYPPEWKRAHALLLERAREIASFTSRFDDLASVSPLTTQVQVMFTGLVIMADWIASNEDGFPLEVAHDQELRTERGLEAVDLTLPWTATTSGLSTDLLYRERFRWDAAMTPRPAQVAIAEAARETSGPTILILEAPTGNGKTEAAFIAAEVLAEREGHGGVMMAAPTMSTANGLFARTLEWMERATPQGGVSSLFLAHSRARLLKDYERLRLRSVYDGTTAHDGQVVASEWMSGRKKGILSTAVVGTVDQVLLAALQAKHSMLRHLGLAGKVIIIDEVHSFDLYMSSYLRTALSWLASYGASVILLSATLPVTQKIALAEAYAAGLKSYSRERKKMAIPPLSEAYPLVTSVSREGVLERTVPIGPPELSARVRLIDDGLDALTATIGRLVVDGGCILVICNTVARAQEAYRELEARWPGEVEVHHAAFMASERSEREDTLRLDLGPMAHRGSGRPYRRIVVATQVAEQSLDIDVDALITDIAPMDLFVQRMGRVHRHARPVADRPKLLRKPQVFVRGFRSAVTEDSAPEFDGGTAAIYGDRLLLATTALLLDSVVDHGFTRPHDVAPLVQAAYSLEPPIPVQWRKAWDEAVLAGEQENADKKMRASTFRIPEPRGARNLHDLFARFVEAQDRTAEETEAFGLAQVRDSSPSLEVIPIVRTCAGYRPLAGDATDTELVPDATPSAATALALASSVLRLPSAVGRNPALLDRIIEDLERTTPAGWQTSGLLRGALALPFNPDLTAEIPGFAFTYNHKLGLITERCPSTPSQGEAHDRN